MRNVGKNLASLVVGASALIGAVDAAGALKIEDIESHTNVVKDVNSVSFPKGRTVYFNCENVKFNNRVPSEKMILLYIKTETNGTQSAIGGLTVYPGSSCASGFFNAKTNSYSGLFPGQVATNSLNGSSYWVGGHNLNENNIAGVYTNDTIAKTWSITWEPGERIDKSQINFSNMPAFPSSGTGPVSITNVFITGYQDAPSNGIPDYFEAKYNLPMDVTTNTHSDADGVSDYNEWVAGTDPTNAASYFKVDSAVNGSNTFSLGWNSLEGRVYDVRSKTNLLDSVWENIATNLPGVSGTKYYDVLKSPAKKQEFYGVSVRLGPYEKVNP